VANKKYVVDLNGEERSRLRAMISKGKGPARALLKVRILLKADESESGAGWTDEQICEALDTNVKFIARVRAMLVTEGFEAVFTRKQRATPPVAPVFDGEKQAQLTALACSQPPEGHARWTIRLLADKVVEMEIVDAAHFNTVGRALKKTNSSHIAKILGDTAISERNLRRGDGGCACGLYKAPRPRPAAGLPRGGVKATRRRNPDAGPHEAGRARAP